jgi:hypothetical protein
VPAALFENHFTWDDGARQKRLDAIRQKSNPTVLDVRDIEKLDQGGKPPLRARVRCESPTQFLGMAQYDLYLLDAEQPFVVNFFKGVLGMWFWLVLAIGVAVACSTYLSGVISWLCVLVLFLTGMLRDYVVRVAYGANEGGGPLESMLRIVGKQNLVTPLDETTTVKVATGGDDVFRFLMRRVLDVIPDVYQYDFTDLVASGFNVPGPQIALTFLYLIGYLLPWAVLSFYLIRSREIAGPL